MLQKGTIGPARNRSLCPRTGKNNHMKDREDGRKDGQWTGPYCPTATRRTWCTNGFLVSNARPFCICALMPVLFFFFSTRVPATVRLGVSREWKIVSVDYHWLLRERKYVPTSFKITLYLKVSLSKKQNVLINSSSRGNMFSDKCRKLCLCI